MEALTLLQEVSDTYRGLKNLAVEAAIVTESGDENSSQRSEHRVRFFYAAPDRIRYEPCGKEGMLQVADGQQFHTIFGHQRFGQGPHVSSVPVAQMHRLPHLFWADFPFSGGGGEAFLFQGIDERVAAAQILRDEDGCHVISVAYEPPSRHPGLIVSGPAVLFWVNAESRMVMRQQGEQGHRFPAGDEVIWGRHSVSIRKMQVNQPLPEDTFRFTPPPGAAVDDAIVSRRHQTFRVRTHAALGRTTTGNGTAVINRTSIRSKQH